VSAAPVLLKHATLFAVPVCPLALHPSVESAGCADTPPELADAHVAAPTVLSVQMYRSRGEVRLSIH
jgi:hypothetical protein